MLIGREEGREGGLLKKKSKVLSYNRGVMLQLRALLTDPVVNNLSPRA
jgi:hypothetical protein